jgi:hypothetical protein
VEDEEVLDPQLLVLLVAQAVVQVMTMAMLLQVVVPAQLDKEIEVATVLPDSAMLLQVVVVVQVELELEATPVVQI